MSADNPTSSEPAHQRAALRRARMVATGMLVAMAGVFAATFAVDAPGTWVLLARAASEAAMVGGLADWFAVTALFRRPMGLPIPHTAVIPRSKDRIAAGLGSFVERNFLDPDLVAERIRTTDPAAHAARWLAQPRRARALAQRILDAVPGALDSVADAEVRGFFQRALSRQLHDADLAPALGRTLAILREGNQHHRLFDQALVFAHDLLGEHEEEIYEAVGHRTRWWIPRTIDRKVAGAIVTGLRDLLAELADPEHPVRQRFETALGELIERLRHDPETRAQVQAMKEELLANPRAQGYLATVWDEVRALIAADIAAPRSVLARGTSRALVALGTALGDDAAMRARVNGWIEATLRRYIVPFRAEIGGFIRDVVRGWDARTMTDRLELAVGRDLQYIRMNGTLVGALVGAALFGLTHAAF